MLPSLDGKHNPKTADLLVDMFRYRTKGPRIVLGEPLPTKPTAERPMPKNIVLEALKVRDFLVADPSRSYRHAASEFGVTKARISQLLKILKALPPTFIAQMAGCNNRRILREFSGKEMLRMAAANHNSGRNVRQTAVSIPTVS